MLGLPSQHPIGAVCGSAARTDLTGGRWETIVPTGTTHAVEPPHLNGLSLPPTLDSGVGKDAAPNSSAGHAPVGSDIENGNVQSS
ncbi:hypothetical protein D3C80_1522840 [compost metagenome]